MNSPKARPKQRGVRIRRRHSQKQQAAPRTAAQYFAKSEKFKDTWDRVLGVVAKMRNEKISLRQASQDVGINRQTVLRWGGPALQKRANGKYVAKANDNLLRVLMVPTPEGTREIALRGSRQASQLGEYWNAVHRYLATGDASQLEKFRGKRLKDANGVEVLLPTNQAELNRLGSAGVLSFESLYARSA